MHVRPLVFNWQEATSHLQKGVSPKYNCNFDTECKNQWCSSCHEDGTKNVHSCHANRLVFLSLGHFASRGRELWARRGPPRAFLRAYCIELQRARMEVREEIWDEYCQSTWSIFIANSFVSNFPLNRNELRHGQGGRYSVRPTMLSNPTPLVVSDAFTGTLWCMQDVQKQSYMP